MSHNSTINSNMNNVNELCNDVCDIEEREEELSIKKEVAILGSGILIYASALIFNLPFLWKLSLFLSSYLLIGSDIVWKALKNLFHGKVFDENFLLTVATAGAFAIQKFPEAGAVMLFFKIGELFQDTALNKSRRSIKSLMEIRPDYANLIIGSKTKKVDPNDVNIGDIILVKPGEKVPLDGIVLDGSSMMDTSALTGESVPKKNKNKR